MAEQPFDSRFELVVLEGGGAGGHHHLARPRITLGRLDAGDEPAPGTLAFPDRTVSRVHAVLAWNPKLHRYVLEHRSRTNYSVVNGTQVVDPRVLQPGDLVKLGALVLRLQALPPSEPPPRHRPPRPIETGLYLVSLGGPEPGAIYPVNYTRLLLRRPPEEPTTTPGVFVPGAGDVQACLDWEEDEVRVVPEPTGLHPVLLAARPGMVLEAPVAEEGDVLPRESCLLLCGEVPLVLAPTARAGELWEAVAEGRAPEALHPLLPGARPGEEPAWSGGEEYVLRVLSGAHRGTRLWLRPAELEGPVTLGPRNAHLPLGERRPPRLDLLFGPRGVELLNADDSHPFTHNWETVTPGEEIRPVSGDRFTVGHTVVSFEHLPTQRIVDSASVFHEDEEHPLVRARNAVGYSPQSEVRIDNRRLGPTHGLLEVREGTFVYRHVDTASQVRVGERELAAGEEARVSLGDTLHLLPDLEIRLGERVMAGRPGDHVLIGPTQEEIAAARSEEP